jgi:hypothetical protein
MAAQHRVLDAFIRLQGSNDYRIQIEGWRVTHSHKPGRITVSAHRGDADAFYSVRGKVTRRLLRANLGEFGRIALRFHPHRGATRRSKATLGPADAQAAREPSRICFVTFKPTLGRFKGTVRFDGENDYTQVRAHSVRGSVGMGKRHCTSAKAGKRPFGAALQAKLGTLSFFAGKIRGDPRPLMLAGEKLRSGRVKILRVAGYYANRGSFRFDSGLTYAHVGPRDPPFFGSADFSAPDEWTGSLSVSFPGAPHVPLTGPGFKVTLESLEPD